MPSARAASSSSRTARRTRPQGVRWIRVKTNMSRIAKPQVTRKSGNWAGTSVQPRSTMKSSIDSEIESQLSSKPKIPWAPLVRSRAFSATRRIASAAAIVTIAK